MTEKPKREGPPPGLIILADGWAALRDSRQWQLWKQSESDTWRCAGSYHVTLAGLLREVLRRELLAGVVEDQSVFGLAEACEAAERRVLEMGARLEVMWGAK